jgi:hypothetical protein
MRWIDCTVVCGLLVAACGDTTATATAADTEGDDGTTSSSSTEGSTSGADVSTESSGASSSSSDTSSTGEIDAAVCERGVCSERCYWPDDTHCSEEPHSRGFVACELPYLCAQGSQCCLMQAIRYGVVGSLSITVDDGISAPEATQIDILGEGRVRRLDYDPSGWCAENMPQFVEGWVGHVPPPGDPFWIDCDPQPPSETPTQFPWPIEAVPVGDDCEGPLSDCPDVDAFVPGCDTTCPMAGDGICDDESGTGLCAPGCDPDDCAG